MKTLLLSNQFPPLEAGVPNFYYHLSKVMSENEFCVLTSQVSGGEEADKVLPFSVYRHKLLTKYRLNYSAKFLLRHIPFLLSFIKIVRKEKVDLVIQGEGRLILLALCYLLQVVFRVPYAVFHHGDSANPHIQLRSDRLIGFFMRKSRGVIANSEFTKNRIMEKYLVDENRVFVVNPGVDETYFKPGIDAKKVIEKHRLQNRTVILTVGRLDKRKGHDHVIMALPDIVSKIPNLTYLIVGEGEERSRLESLVKQTGMEQHVLFAGTASFGELPAYYNACDLFVMANREADEGDTEGFGMVFIEANSCGKAVVAGRFGGAVEAVEEGVSGVFTDATEPGEISKTIIETLLDSAACKKLGAAGRDRVERQFTWERKQQDFKEILSKLLLA